MKTPAVILVVFLLKMEWSAASCRDGEFIFTFFADSRVSDLNFLSTDFRRSVLLFVSIIYIMPNSPAGRKDKKLNF